MKFMCSKVIAMASLHNIIQSQVTCLVNNFRDFSGNLLTCVLPLPESFMGAVKLSQLLVKELLALPRLL